MGKLSRGITFQSNSHVTQAMLHALIDSAVAASDAFPGAPTLYDIVMGDLLSCKAIDVQDAPGSPTTNDLQVGSDGFLNVYDGAAWQDLTNDYVYLVNNSGITLATGNPVVGDTSSPTKCKLWGGQGICYEPLGVAVTVAANGATCSIQVRGVAPVFVNYTPAVDDFLSIQAFGATGLSKTTSVMSDVLAVVVATDTVTPSSGKALALLIH